MPSPKCSLMLVALCTGFTALPITRSDAAPGTAEVAVRDVKFSKVRAPRGGGTWLEGTVELEVRAKLGGGDTGRWFDRLGVSLALGFRNRDGEFSFYRSSAELVALEAGRASVRFFLPPEILSREKINSDPHSFLVELSAAGRELPGRAASRLLQSPEALESFQDRVLQSAAMNDGVLVPQFESPFVHEYGADTPSFLRRPR